ncbi:MAG: ATP-binding protein [Planctomycetes bacterium]|nr:ATP-binding protein [Planctomycetota bacterium]
MGRPHVALAELIKNSYDADATRVELRVLPDRIEITDNGDGMDLEAFRNFWMRIGSPHKEARKYSPTGRNLTGQRASVALPFSSWAVSLRLSPGPRQTLTRCAHLLIGTKP